jgi:hypothetical protein
MTLWNRNKCIKAKVIKFSKVTKPSTDYNLLKPLKNVKYFKYLGNMIAHDARCTSDIKSTVVMAKGAFNKKVLFINKLKLYLKKELEIMM